MLNALIKMYFNVLVVSGWLHGQVCVFNILFIKFYACMIKFAVLVSSLTTYYEHEYL